MRNIEMKVVGTKLTIVVDLTKPGTPSSTGKTKLIASGAAPVDYEKLPGLKVAVNVTVPL